MGGRGLEAELTERALAQPRAHRRWREARAYGIYQGLVTVFHPVDIGG